MLWKQSYAGTHHHYCKHHRAQEKPNKYKVGIPVYIIIILLCRDYFDQLGLGGVEGTLAVKVRIRVRLGLGLDSGLASV